MFDMIIDTGPNFYAVLSHRSSQGQGHRQNYHRELLSLSLLLHWCLQMFNFFVQVFMDLITWKWDTAD